MRSGSTFDVLKSERQKDKMGPRCDPKITILAKGGNHDFTDPLTLRSMILETPFEMCDFRFDPFIIRRAISQRWYKTSVFCLNQSIDN